MSSRVAVPFAKMPTILHRGRRLASEKLAAEAAPTRSNAAPSAGGDLDPDITDLDPLPGAYLAGLAQLDLAVNAHHAAGDQHLAGTAAVANPHQLEQLVEFDEVAVELEVELVHGETGEASTTASPLMLTNGSTAMVRRSSNGADVVGVACTSGAAAGAGTGAAGVSGAGATAQTGRGAGWERGGQD